MNISNRLKIKRASFREKQSEIFSVNSQSLKICMKIVKKQRHCIEWKLKNAVGVCRVLRLISIEWQNIKWYFQTRNFRQQMDFRKCYLKQLLYQIDNYAYIFQQIWLDMNKIDLKYYIDMITSLYFKYNLFNLMMKLLDNTIRLAILNQTNSKSLIMNQFKWCQDQKIMSSQAELLAMAIRKMWKYFLFEKQFKVILRIFFTTNTNIKNIKWKSIQDISSMLPTVKS